MSDAYRVRWTPEAEEDAVQIVDWFDDVINANKIIDQFEKRANSLATLPNRGRIVPELKRLGVTQYKELLWKPWRMIYAVKGKTVWIMAVLDGRRELIDLLYERLVR